MLKYARITDEQTGKCDIATGTDSTFYQKIGMTELDVTKSEVDGCWYLSEKLDNDEYRAQVEEARKKAENEIIKNQLNEIDLKSIRALRCNETERLQALEQEARKLREKLNK